MYHIQLRIIIKGSSILSWVIGFIAERVEGEFGGLADASFSLSQA